MCTMAAAFWGEEGTNASLPACADIFLTTLGTQSVPGSAGTIRQGITDILRTGNIITTAEDLFSDPGTLGLLPHIETILRVETAVASGQTEFSSETKLEFVDAIDTLLSSINCA